MMVREKNCYYAIALTDFFVFLSCAEKSFLLFECFEILSYDCYFLILLYPYVMNSNSSPWQSII